MNFKHIFVAIQIAVVLVCQPLPAAAGSAPNADNPDAFLREQMRADRIPGLAVTMIKDGQVVFSKGYGQSAGAEITPDSRFYIGSVSKSFTALAVLQLAQAGKVDLDSPVKRYIPWFEVADEEVSDLITLRQLLNHTSGLSDKDDPNVAKVTTSLEEQARLLKDVHLTAPLGSTFQYYNQNYRLLGLVIETVSGMPYVDYIENNIFQPLGMTRSTAHPENAADLVQGHGRMFGMALPEDQSYNPGALPSGYLISTAADMARFVLALMDNRTPDGGRLLDEQWMTAMRTLPDGVNTQYGMGCLVLDGGNTIALGGMLDFYQAFYLFHPQKRSGMVLLINQNGAENMLFENNDIRDGLLKIMDGQTPTARPFGLIGWGLALLAALDLVNHIRLFAGLKKWAGRINDRSRRRMCVKAIVGLVVPAVVVVGILLGAAAVQGGTADWSVPMRMAPDLTLWLLAGMALNFARNAIRAGMMVRRT
jgi:CubicO group peptidase (beta-lactamase class C family)